MLGLKLSDAKRPLVTEARKKTPSEVVLAGIRDQIGLLKDSNFTTVRTKYVRDGDSSVKKEVVTKPKSWFWKGDDGVFCVQIRYGSSHVVPLDPSKPTIIAGKNPQDVIKVLETVAEAVKSGKLEGPISTVAERAKRRKATA